MIRDSIERAFLQASFMQDMPSIDELRVRVHLFIGEMTSYARNKPVVVMLGGVLVMFLIARILTQGRR